MTKLLITVLLIIIPVSLYGANITFSTGPGYKKNEYNDREYLSVNAGLSTYFPYKDYSAFGFEYYYTINAEWEDGVDYSSSLFILSYRNYFFQKPTTRNTSRIFIPFFAVTHSTAIENHRHYSPGFEFQIGADLVYQTRIGIMPWDWISYIASYALDRKQLVTIAFFGGIYYLKEDISYNTGVRISTGIVF